MNAFKSLSVALVLAGAAAGALAAATLGSDQFAPGWQAHARALINSGPSRLDIAKTAWFVPGITPPGRYVLIERHDDRAEVIEGYEFKVNASIDSRIHMIVPARYGNVEALPIEDVPALADHRSATGSR